jgi:hypothetical protein
MQIEKHWLCHKSKIVPAGPAFPKQRHGGTFSFQMRPARW